MFIQYWKLSYQKKDLRLIFFYLLITLLLGALEYFNTKIVLLNQLWTLVEATAFLSFLYLQIINRAVRKAVLITGILFAGFIFLYHYYNKSEGAKFDSIQIGIETIIVLVFSFYFLYEKTNDTETLYIYSTFQFWIVIGIVLYLGGSLFVHISAIILPQEEVNRFWIVPNTLSIVRKIFFAIAITLNSKPPKEDSFPDFKFSSLN